MSDTPQTDMPTAEQVLAFIAANPAFLEANRLVAPRRDDKIIDIAPAIAKRAQQEARHMRDANQSMRHAAAANMVSWQKLHYATLALLASTDLASFGEVIAQDFPPIFDLSACVVITESTVPADPGFIAATAADIADAFGSKTLFLGAPTAAMNRLLGTEAPSIAMIRLPDQLGTPISTCLMVLAGKDADSFAPDLGSELVTLLAEMVGVTLAARLEIATAEAVT